MISAFGVDHGEIEKAFNFGALRGAGKAGKHAGKSGTPLADQLAAKHGIPGAAGGGKRIAATPGKRKGGVSFESDADSSFLRFARMPGGEGRRYRIRVWDGKQWFVPVERGFTATPAGAE